MKKVLIVSNCQRDKDGLGLKSVIDCVVAKNIDYTLMNIDECRHIDVSDNKDYNMVIVIGGDGTLLSASNPFINTEIPVLGINHGNVGYLTELEKNDIQGFYDILDGKYITDKRPVIKVTYQNNTYYSINEAAIHRGNSPKMLNTEVIIDDVVMNKYRADGVIVATSTGSTAYSLSAGGPIISPLVNAFVITPVCPHNLHIRSIVVPTDDKICIRLKDTESAAVSVDGKLIAQLNGNNEVYIEKGGYLNTVRRSENSFYKKIKRKIFEKEI